MTNQKQTTLQKEKRIKNMSIHAMNFYVMKMNEPEPYSTCLNVGEF